MQARHDAWSARLGAWGIGRQPRRGGPTLRALTVVVGVSALLSLLLLPAAVTAASSSLSISVVGDHFVNGDSQTVRLLGVDVPSTEYACEEGWGDASLTTGTAADAAVADSIASWNADAVRIPLNEDCWLGINGQPSYGTQAGYQESIENEVSALNAQGIYAILDLHWSAPGTVVANGQRPMPDDHSAAFWTSVATTFERNPAVVFDVFNEPFSPVANDDGSGDAVSWSCWESGGCQVPAAADGTSPNDADSYTAVGMQALVTAIRDTGASQPIMLGGLSYANDLSGWLAHEPTDPTHQLAASFHNYYGESCDTVACWNSTIAPVAAAVPVVTGEFDQAYDCQDSPTSPPALVNFDDDYMNWADANGVSYTAWGWWELSPDPGTTPCTNAAFGGGGNTFALIDDEGNAVSPDGTNLKAHLHALVSGPSATSVTVTSSPAVSTLGQAVTLVAHVSAHGGGTPVGTVAFASNDSSFGGPVTVISGTATLVSDHTTLELPVGTDAITATFDPAQPMLQATSEGGTVETVGPIPTPPAVASISPTSGPAIGHTTVTIIGTGFNDVTAVSFGSTRALSYRVVSPSRMTAVSPAQGLGPENVSVTTNGGSSATVSGDRYTYVPLFAACVPLSLRACLLRAFELPGATCVAPATPAAEFVARFWSSSAAASRSRPGWTSCE